MTDEELNVNLVILVNGLTLISHVESRTVTEIGDPEYRMTEPFVLDVSNGTLSPWLAEHTSQNKFTLGQDKIITMAVPSTTLLEKYKTLIK